MKKLSILGFSMFLALSANYANAQSAPFSASARMTKVTQVGYYLSGTTKKFVVKGIRATNGVTNETFELRGNIAADINCLDLVTKQNSNSIVQNSNILLQFTSTLGSGGGVVGGPINYTYDGVVFKACYLSNN